MAFPTPAAPPTTAPNRALTHYPASVAASPDDTHARAIDAVRDACLEVVRVEDLLREVRAQRATIARAHASDLRLIGWTEATRRIGNDARGRALISEGTLRTAAGNGSA